MSEELNNHEKKMASKLGNAPIVNTSRFKDPVPGFPREINGEQFVPGDWDPDELGLPPDCPVKPLGVDDDIKYFLTPIGTVGTISSTRGGKKVIVNLFITRNNYLAWAWPLPSKADPARFNAEVAERAMIEACGAKGSWNPMDKIKGRGAHLNEYFKLVYNSGRYVYLETVDNRHNTGEIGKYLYPGRPPAPEPWAESIPPGTYSPMRELSDMLETWNWKRGIFDADLLLGWIGLALIGGAVPWRAHVFLTGERGTGKSTLMQLIGHLMSGGLVMAADTTAAGIYQALKNDTIAVAIDEMEASADDRGTQKVLELVRISSSGGKALRGGAEHKGVEFTLRSCFLMSAINIPALKPQDRSRISILQLEPLIDKSGGPNMDGTRLEVIGQQLLRRMIDGWPNFNEVFYIFRKALIEGCDLDSRGGDQFGSLIAAHYILVSDGIPNENEVEYWVRRVKEQLKEEYSNSIRNWQGCLDHLLDQTVESWRTKTQTTIRALLYRQFDHDGENKDLGKARGYLSEIGCSIVWSGGDRSIKQAKLFVPANNVQLAKHYSGSVWRSTGASQGVWHDTLGQAPKDMCPLGRAKVLGHTRAGRLIKISDFMNFEDPLSSENKESKHE